MNNIPPKLRAQLAADPEYTHCMRKALLNDHECERDPLKPRQEVEWEHVIIYASNQLQERWAIIPICWLVHRGGMLDKEINEWIALNRATDEELLKISKAVHYPHRREYLNEKYGVPNFNVLIPQGINY